MKLWTLLDRKTIPRPAPPAPAPSSQRPEIRRILTTPHVQTKLTVGAPGDAHEREADHVADQVMRMPEPARVQRACSCGGSGSCETCQEEAALQRKAGGGEGTVGVAPPIVQDVLRSPGQPLDASARDFLEPRLGTDLGGVRVHTDPQAAESARSVHARAYTVGSDIVFAPGQYAPQTGEGRRLLAHELTHVVQQSAGAAPILRRDEPEPSEETLKAPKEDEKEPKAETLWQRILRIIDEILLWLKRLFSSEPELPPREKVPPDLDKKCLTFTSKADLDKEKASWETKIKAMPVADVIQWIVDGNSRPADVDKEAIRQKNCMLFAMSKSSKVTMPAKFWEGGHRSYADQERIWLRKFNFDKTDASGKKTKKFDRITADARKKCGSLLPAGDKQWNPHDSDHETCWKTKLSAAERQKEILQASSAPGISRHHWGSDFDLFSTEPADFETGKTFRDEFEWLEINAGTYGFLQSFTATSAPGGAGYMEERWHWSYYPISQALLEFAKTHQKDIEKELFSRWGSASAFSFIKGNWKDFVFNVNETPNI